MRRIRRHLTYANVMVTILAFIVLGGGTALAAYVVSSNSQIGPGTVSGHKPPAGKHANLIAGSVNSSDIADNSITGADVVNNSLGSADLAPAARGARAYGRVSSNGTLSRSKNIASVINPVVGIYCITLANSIAPASAVLVGAGPRRQHHQHRLGEHPGRRVG